MKSQDQSPAWKRWLLFLAQNLGLVAALTAALVYIAPLLTGRPNWLAVLFGFLIIFIFTALHSLISTIQDPALRAALGVVLDKLEQILQRLNALSARLATLEERAGMTGDSANTSFSLGTIKPPFNQPRG